MIKSAYAARSPSPRIDTAPRRGRQTEYQKTGCTSQRYIPSDFFDVETSMRRMMPFLTFTCLQIPNIARVIPNVKGEVYRTGFTFPNHVPSSPEKTRLPTEGIRKAKENTPRTARHTAKDGGFAMWSCIRSSGRRGLQS